MAVEYLGHTISPEGLRPSNKKVEAATATPAPTDTSKLRPFLGLMNFLWQVPAKSLVSPGTLTQTTTQGSQVALGNTADGSFQ